MEKSKRISHIKHVSLSVLESRMKRAVRPKDRLWALLRLAEELAGHEAVQIERALLLFAEAELLAETTGERRGVASAIRGAGNCHLRLSNHVAALALLERALPIAEQTGYAECEIAILRDMGHIYRRQSRQDLALKTLGKCAELAELIGNTHIQASALDLMGTSLHNLGRYQEALGCFTKGLALLDDTDPLLKGVSATTADRAIILMNIGNALRSLGRYAEALSALGQSHRLSVAGNRNEGLCQGSIGVLYAEMGDYPNALSFLFASATILEQVGDKRNLANTYGNLMRVYLLLGNTEQTADFGEKAIAVFDEIGDKLGQAATYENLGEYYLDRGQNIRAKQLLKRCLNLSREIGSKDYEADALTVLAKLDVNLCKFTTADKLYQKALAIASESGYQEGTIAALLGLGALFHKRGEPDQALPILERAVTIAGEIHSRRHEQKAHQMLADVLEAKGEIKRALIHSKLASGIKEEILGMEKQKTITEIQIRFNIEKSEQETALLKKEVELMKHGRDLQSQEIERMTISLAEKTEAIRKISRRIKEIIAGYRVSGVASPPNSQNPIPDFSQFEPLLSEIEQEHLAGAEKKIFHNEFQLVHRDILERLSKYYPNLTLMERKICVLLREQLSAKEMAVMLKVSTRTIGTHRYRIRKKMKIGRRASLITVLEELQVQNPKR